MLANAITTLQSNEDSVIACVQQTRCSVCNHIHLATCQRGEEGERGRDGLDGFLLPGEKKVHVCERASVLPATAMPLLRCVGLVVA